ncbi:8-oxo-dGTP diphosphatase [Cytobacillus purgationiresistens]|uniref:8-oxo-dGTP diphosphatase n=1 Tax=Cytobacillus purgationiresistens TaxID=863449 RepID=A0ABU0ARA2_9BACI|nr:8-oxo-dGTP diphosphatase [Cytobacillus purgationiresistens]
MFLQKNTNASLYPGLLVPVGGHMEHDEINDPKKACIREVEEETGLLSEQIDQLTLRYIVSRIKGKDEIRIQYVFFGTVSKRFTLIDSDEGSLTWTKISDIAREEISATTNEIICHFLDVGKQTQGVYVGCMKSSAGKPGITWGSLEDWE